MSLSPENRRSDGQSAEPLINSSQIAQYQRRQKRFEHDGPVSLIKLLYFIERDVCARGRE